MPPFPDAALVETIPLAGFDAAREPEVRRFADGSLQVVFGFMPPSFVPDEGWVELGRYRKLDQEMAQALGVTVVWEERQFFRIQHPRDDTIDRLRRFLASYHAGG